jgi:hypothetical protein
MTESYVAMRYKYTTIYDILYSALIRDPKTSKRVSIYGTLAMIFSRRLRIGMQ